MEGAIVVEAAAAPPTALRQSPFPSGTQLVRLLSPFSVAFSSYTNVLPVTLFFHVPSLSTTHMSLHHAAHDAAHSVHM